MRFDTVVGEFNVPPALCNPIGIQLISSSKKKRTGETLEVDMYLFAAGRIPNTADMGLDKAGIQIDDRGRVMVDENLETSAKNVYAAGDVLGPPGLASTGIEQGTAAVSAMFGDVYEGSEAEKGSLKFDPKSYLSAPDRFPIGIWTSPEVSYIGLIKDKALEQGIQAVEGRARYADTTRGRVSRSRGMLKLVVDAEQRDLPVIGVSIFGEDACELVHYGMELVQSKRSLRKVLEATHAAVTYHELYKVAAADIDSQLEFGVQLRQVFTMETLNSAKEAFLDAVKKNRRGSKINTGDDGKIPKNLTIPYSDAEDIARSLSLMNPIDEGVGGPEFTFCQFLEFLRQLRKGQSSSISVRAAELV
uniref:NAD(P)(+) transhydrogenase (Si-specific) n=1 Tax=Lotharella oceanica TaxID=641309 RepID=A0A7S2X6U7_9EUKA